MNDASGFTKLVPGFDFLQSLVKNAGAALPGIGQWIAPTLDPKELEKRIEELRTVQFWLEQNARMIGATIQALEVQRMTLSTLKTMNVQMDDLRESMTIRMPTAAPPEPAPAPASKAAAEADAMPATAPPDDAPASAAPKLPGAVDPMMWWGALTKQFAELATTAMKDTAGGAARTMAGAMVKQTLDGTAVKGTGADHSTSAAPAGRAAKAPAAKHKAAPRKSTARRA